MKKTWDDEILWLPGECLPMPLTNPTARPDETLLTKLNIKPGLCAMWRRSGVVLSFRTDSGGVATSCMDARNPLSTPSFLK